MAGITKSDAETQLAAYMAAETAVLKNQSYSLAGRSVTRADLAQIRDGIKFWNNEVKRLSGGGITIRGITPVG